MTIDETGNHEHAPGVHPLRGTICRRQLPARPDPLDNAILPRERRVGDRMDLPLPSFGAAGGELGDVVEELQVISFE